jgi:hypothetical protein
MTARDCFKGKIALGRVSQRAGARILALLSQEERLAAAGDRVGAQEAARNAQAIAAHDAVAKQARVVSAIRAQSDILRVQGAYESEIAALRKQGRAPAMMGVGEGKSTLGAAVASLFTRDPREIGSKWDNVDMLARTLRGEAHARMAGLIDALRPKALGLKSETLKEHDVLKALFGEPSTEEGRAAAKTWDGVAEHVRAGFNNAAGYEAIPKRADWRIGNPAFDPAKVAAMPRGEFVRAMSELLAADKMTDFRSGGALRRERLPEILNQVYDNARNDHAEGAPNSGFVGEGPLSERRNAQRVLVYKDSASWLKANELFGRGTGVFDSMLRHVSSMTHDAAIMRVLGNDPASTKRFIESLFDREPARLYQAGEAGDAKSLAAAVKANRAAEASVRGGRDWFETLYAHMTGQASLSTNPGVAMRMAEARHFLMAGQLGTSIVSAISDLGLLTATARFDGLPITNLMRGLVELMATKGGEISAAQAGLTLDTLAHGAGMADRYMGETIRAGWASKMSSAVIRGIGHRVWTGKIRDAFALETMANLANFLRAGTAFDALKPAFRDMLERYGVGAADWEKLKGVPLWEPRQGAAFLRPMDVRAAGDERVADALGRMVQTEMHYTAIEGDALTRAIMYGRNAPGSLTGEASRAFWQYKSWPTTILTTQIARSLARGWDGRRLSHLAFTLAAMTLFGAAATQMKQIAAGKQPLNMDPQAPEGRQAWLKAFVQGGGLGLFSDLAFSDTMSGGGSLLAAAGGPVGGAAADAFNWARTEIGRANKGEQTNWAGDAYWIAARYLPGNNVFYAKLAVERELLDQLGLMADPRAPERFARIEARARQDFHQDYWWKPGKTAPTSGVDLGKMAGQ